MARVRYLGHEQVTVPELGDRAVEPDEIVEVPDARYWGYASQTTNWEPIEEPPGFVVPGTEPPADEDTDTTPTEVAPLKAPARKTAAKTLQKDEG